MVNEKKILLVFLFIIAGVLLVSFSPGLTGYSIREGEQEPSLVLTDVLSGSTLRTELDLEVEAESVSYAKVMVTGEAAKWIRFISEEYVFLPDHVNHIPLYISIPEGTEEGEYEAKIALLSVGEEGAVFEDQIISYIPISITVTTEQKDGEFSLSSFQVYDTEFGAKVYYRAELENLANFKQDAEIQLLVYDEEGKLVSEEILGPSFLAFETKEIVSSFSDTFVEGKYYAKLKAGETSESTDFSVVGEGDLKRKGELLYLETSVAEDSLISIEGYFLNLGEGVESVSFTGEVVHDENTVESFETEAQIVLPGEYGVFSYSYSEPLQGAYSVDTEIRSGNIVLAEKSTEFYSSDAISLESNVVIIISLIMMLLIVTHFVLTRRRE